MQIPSYLKYILVAAFGFIFFGLIQANQIFIDPDSFYHAKIAALMLKQGIIYQFPWLAYTNLPQIYTDHHFLYHIFLLPFVLTLPPLVGAKVAAVFINTAFILFFYRFLKTPLSISPLARRREGGVRWPFLYVLLLLAGAPFIFRINLVKASGFSLIFLMFILHAIFRKKYIWLGVLSFFYVWAYGGWPLSIVLSGIFLFSSFLSNYIDKNKIWPSVRKSEWRPLVATIAGSLAGLIINPYFPQNLKFYWIQIVQIALVNYQSKIGVGAEWYGFDTAELVTYSGGILLVLGIAMLFFFGRIMMNKKMPANHVLIRNIFFFMISAGFFFVLTLKSCRNTEYLFPFMVMAAAFMFKYFWDKEVYLYLKKQFLKIFKREILYRIFLIYLAGMLIMAFGVNFWKVKTGLQDGFGFEKYKKAMEIVKSNTKKGDIVFHSDWDDWPMLFYHNIYNRYIVGLDARFMYAYDKELYQKWRDITWGRYEGDVYSVIKNDFKAEIIFIAEGDIENSDKYYKNDPRFELLYDEEGKVYRVN